MAKHLGRNQVRAVSMASTDGVVRSTKVKNTGAPISVPVGMNTLGRVFNLLGEVDDDADTARFAVRGGFLQVMDDHVMLLRDRDVLLLQNDLCRVTRHASPGSPG